MTASVPRRPSINIWQLCAGLFVIVAFVVGIFTTLDIATKDRCVIVLPSQCISLEHVDTPADRELGLSGRVDMPEGKGMLFVFDQPTKACMWMKDMQFPLDMVWLNQDEKIIKIQRAITPETYPESFCANNSLYVIELNSGIADKAGLRVGQQLNL